MLTSRAILSEGIESSKATERPLGLTPSSLRGFVDINHHPHSLFVPFNSDKTPRVSSEDDSKLA